MKRIRSIPWRQPLHPILDDLPAAEFALYTTLLCLTNLYRIVLNPVLKLKHGKEKYSHETNHDTFYGGHFAVFDGIRSRPSGDQRGHRSHHFGPAEYLVHELKLSDAQKAQIQALWQAERPILAVHIHDLLAENKEMSTVAATSIPDQSEVQKIANREANTIAAMLMEKARLQSKIYSTVLSPDQRAKADELEKNWESRLDRFANQSTEM